MVTKLADGRGQTTVKSREIDDEWEALVKKAAERSGLTFAGSSSITPARRPTRS